MKIYKLGEEVLYKKAEPVTEITPDMQKLFDEMFETMISADGVGLAGPQVGISLRFFVIIADDNVRRVFVNPQIIGTSSETVEYEEGCLSVPGVYETIIRPKKVTVQAVNEKGKPFTLEAEGFLARIIQHEYDHLDGILYLDRGDSDFKQKTEENFKKRTERAAQKEQEKQARHLRIEAKKAAEQAKKNRI